MCEKCNIKQDVFTIVPETDELKAVAKAVQMVHDGEGDVLMKGLCSTDKFLRAILNKEVGLLPPKGSAPKALKSADFRAFCFVVPRVSERIPEQSILTKGCVLN